ncbi:glyoxalase/bleomycin resistance/dioxygenase family protein [Exilibacterium tricleocarpae]|uniref:Glyoxalase/bleomycin resistance/dioxygenase family protein n=1 Tax=Exilibacterium tricleocarpae TaxID=2591008 RepID=A0A545T058_9GAMM|nr:ArsI/CadI family heavy metal resistance metalloenzyme [Exilibacterium tricleocarpae]TQV70590.1 glyoxalase/bleomycin resistance/dioxygenase family protein [Exilibacterium tricleocarpae]
MKRMHIHVGVEKLDDSIKFYSALFGTEPAKTKDDYAKWALDDPRINFAISTRAKRGVDHLGLQVDEAHELEVLRKRLKNADMSLFDEGETVCCYARSDKSWVTDPAGIAWEAYQALEDVQLLSDTVVSEEGACCTPETKGRPGCCVPSEKAVGCCG